MTYLADTHVLLWALSGDPRLGPRARESLTGAAYTSSVSILELTIKKLKGRLDLPERFLDEIDERGFTVLPLLGEHALALDRFPELVGRDPFDRALLAQASVEGLSFLTVDARLLGLGLDRVVDARL